MMSRPPTAIVLLTCSLLAGCGSQTKTNQTPPQSSSPQPQATGRPPAIAFDARIDWAQLQPYLAEIGGREVLEEAILDAAIDRELAKSGQPVTAAAIEAERRIVIETVAEESQTSGDQAAGLVEELRRARGLGPKRYAGQLRRNAALRAMVAGGVLVGRDEIELARRLNYGERVKARLVVCRDERDASAIRASLAPLSGDQLRAEFTRLAMERSVHSTRASGGDLGVVSPEDPSLAVPLQEELRSTGAGSLTGLVLVAEGYGLALVESRLPATTAPTDAEIERRVRLRKERIAMDELANRLVAGARVTVFDESLRWSWEQGR
jgi:hypothetical protein